METNTEPIQLLEVNPATEAPAHPKLTNFSYSKLDTFCQCGFKYKLQYVDGHYIFSGSIATEFGTLIHRTEELIGIAIKDNVPINYIELKNNFIRTCYELSYKYPNDYYKKDKSDRNYQEKAFLYLESGIYRLENFMNAHPNFQIVGLEQNFVHPYNDKVQFKGAIDRILYDNETNNYLVQDIKSWSVPADHKDLTTPLQFVIYSLAVADLYKCDLNQISCQYDLPLCDLQQDAGTAGYIARGVKKLDKLFEKIDNKEFQPNPNPLCHWCNYCPTNPNQPEGGKNLCPYYSKWTPDYKVFGDNSICYKWKGLDKHQEVLNKYLEDVQKEVI